MRQTGLIACVVVMLVSLSGPSRLVGAQAPIDLFGPDDPIPHQYKSWSLFLLCNPAWLLEDRRSDVIDLYRRYKAFGESIGPDHAAIWFWRTKDSAALFGGSKAIVELVDVSRSSTYCEKYGLLPSEGPHVLVTTGHPDDDPRDRSVLKLNDLDPDSIAVLLGKVADQVLVKGLNQEDLDSERAWRTWKEAVESVLAAGVSWIDKVVLTIDTKFFKLEVSGGSD